MRSSLSSLFLLPWFLLLGSCYPVNQFDTEGPSVILTSSDPSEIDGSISVSGTFSETVVGFDETDISVTNSTVSSFLFETETRFTYTLVPTRQGAITTFISKSVASDKAGNANRASNLISSPPNPISVTAIIDPWGDTAISWLSGGGNTAGFQIAFKTGDYPTSCQDNDANIIENWFLQIYATENRLVILDLPPNTTFYFRVCSVDIQGNISGGADAIARVTTPRY